MEAVIAKDYCEIDEREIKKISEDNQEVKPLTIILLVIVIILLGISMVLGYFILTQKNQELVTNQNAVPITVIPTQITPSPTPNLDTPEGVEQELINIQVDSFDSELQDIETDLNQL